MNTLRRTLLATSVLAIALLTGCITAGPGYDPDDPYGGPDPYRSNSIEGTVARVNPVDGRIVINRTDREGRYDLRNGGGGEVAFYYDNRTEVEYAGRAYRPQDLEVGDRIRADVADTGDRLIAQQIEVVYNISSGAQDSGPDTGYDRGDRGGYDDDNDRNGDNDRDGDRSDRGGGYDRQDQESGPRVSELRGTVRSVDIQARTFEVDVAGYDQGSSRRRAEVVVVRYDSRTVVEFNSQTAAPEGSRYEPENLERGDVVEVHTRETGDNRGNLLAERIAVVGEGQPVR